MTSTCICIYFMYLNGRVSGEVCPVPRSVECTVWRKQIVRKNICAHGLINLNICVGTHFLNFVHTPAVRPPDRFSYQISVFYWLTPFACQVIKSVSLGPIHHISSWHFNKSRQSHFKCPLKKDIFLFVLLPKCTHVYFFLAYCSNQENVNVDT